MPSELLYMWIFIFLAVVSWIWALVVGFRHSTVLGILTIFFHPIPIIIIAFLNWRDTKYPMLFSVFSIIGMLYFIWNTNSAGAFMDIAQGQASGEINEIQAAREARAAMEEQLERMRNDDLISDEVYAQQRAEAERQYALPAEEMTPVDPGSQPGSVPETDVVVEDPAAPTPAAPVEAPPDTTTDVAVAEPEPEPTIKPPVLSDHHRRALTPRGPVIRAISFENARQYVGKKIWVVDKTGRERVGILARVERDRIILERRLNKGAMSFVIYDDQIKQIRVELKAAETQ